MSVSVAELPTLNDIESEWMRRSALVWTQKRRPRIHGRDFVIPSPLHHVYTERAREVVVRKAAQVMASEWAVNLAFWCADTQAGKRGNVLYIFPAIAQLGDFVRARIDTAIEQSEYLQERVRPVRGLQMEVTAKAADNVGLKRVGDGFIYFRGSNAKAGLLSVDADLVIYDEVDRLTEGTLSLGAERLGSSFLRWQRYLSTPTYPEIGVDALWLQSTRHRWHVTCPTCSLEQYFSFPDSLREDGVVVCRSCHKPLDHLSLPGHWLAENSGAELVGYHLDKFLSPRADMAVLAKTGYRILARDETDPSKIQEWWNQGCGLPHAPEGGQLSRAEIEACKADYSLDQWFPQGTVMGVDVGAKLHVRVNGLHPSGKVRAADIRTVSTFEELDTIMQQYDVSVCVIDALPEGHKAREFAGRWPGRVWLCYYQSGDKWAGSGLATWNDETFTVQAHRTLTLDGTFARIRERRIEYPREVMDIPGFSEQLMAPVRVIETGSNGNPVARYVEGGKADHYTMAENYCNIAESRALIGSLATDDDTLGVQISDYGQY